MANMAENHTGLELCINEFFGAEASNERKKEIDAILHNFLIADGSWKQALFSLNLCIERKLEPSHQFNQYVIMYCLSILENTVRCRWCSMNSEDQNQLKSAIYTTLVRHSNSTPSQPSQQETTQKCPKFVRNKIIKVLADVGKFDWPHAYPTFFTNIYQILQNDETILLGLIFLQTISDEWPNIKDELSTERKQQLKGSLIQEVPKIFQLVHQILMVGLKHRTISLAGTTGTPPASPSSSYQSQSSHSANQGQQQFHSQMDEIVQLALEITGQYASWVPLDCSVPFTNEQPKTAPFRLELIQSVCQFALFDTCSHTSISGMNHSIQAMNSLCEFLYRKFIPKQFDEQMNFICRFGVELLNKILNQSSPFACHDQYLPKVIEFLCLIASSHFYRYDEQTSKAFMSLLLPFTFKQEETYYYECIEIWARLLDHLNAQLPIVNLTSDRDTFIQNIKQPLLGLAAGIVRSTAKFKVIEEECFDFEDDDDVEIHSLTRNIDILVKIGDLLPTESLELVKNMWAETCQFFVSLKPMGDSKTCTRLDISNITEIEHFHFVVQLIGRASTSWIFYGDVFKQELTLGKTLIQQLVLVYSYSKNFYHVKEPNAVIKANREIINSLRCWMAWLSRYHSEIVLVESTLEDQQMFFEMLGTIVQTIFYALENHTTIDSSILLSSVSFFYSFVNSIRTQYIFQMSSVQTLIQQIHGLRSTFSSEITRTLHTIVSIVLLLPWQSVSLQEWEERSRVYSIYMKKLCHDIMESTSIENTVFYLQIVFDQLELLMTECAVSKKMCWDVLQDLIPFLQKLSTMYLRQPGIGEEIINVFLKIMKVLRQQAGVQFFEVTIQGFLTLFAAENVISDLMKDTETSAVIVDKFLQMLQYVIKDSSPSFKKFLGDTMSICFDNIYPILAQRSSPDLKIGFFELQRDILHYRWNHFFPVLVLQQQNNSMQSSPTTSQNATKRLDQILQSIGHSFLQADLEVFRFNLLTLTFLNEKHNLYQKLSSRPLILQQFITVLMQVLIQKSHDLLRDDIIRVIHEMSIALSTHFQTTFLPEFLSIHFPRQTVDQRNHLLNKFGKISSLAASENNNTQIDLPTFTQNINEFMEDLRHFRFVQDCQALGNSTEGSSTSGSSQSSQVK